MAFDDDNQDRPPSSNRFFFNNAPQGRGRILSREGYAAFTSSFTVTWFLCIFFVVWLHLELKATNEIISTISSSAVDLAALSLAVLTILHEFNKEDRWFKLGLFLVGFLFVIDCLIGFYMVVSWNVVYETVQSVDIIIFGVLIVGLIFQSDWELVYTKYSARVPKIFQRSFLLLSNIKPLNLIRAYIPFIIPFAFIWVNRLSPIITFLLIFLGGIIALLSLMVVTSVDLVRRRKLADEQTPEDPIVTYSRKIAVEQLETSKNLQKLQEDIIGTLSDLQAKRQVHAQESADLVSMVTYEVIVAHLRLKGIVTRQSDIQHSLKLLEKQNRIFNKSSEYWITPSKDQINSLAENIKKVTWFGAKIPFGQQNKYQLEWKGFDSSELIVEFSKTCHVPIAVAEEFIVPKAFAILYNPKFFEYFEFSGVGYYGTNIVFSNLETKKKIKIQEWAQPLKNAHIAGLRNWFKHTTTELEDGLTSILSHPVDSSTTAERVQEISKNAQQAISTGKETINFILSLDDNPLLNFTDKYFAKTMKDFYSQLLLSKYYIDEYYPEFSKNSLGIIMGVLENGVFINNSNLTAEFDIYKRNQYFDFLKTLGLDHSFNAVNLLSQFRDSSEISQL